MQWFRGLSHPLTSDTLPHMSPSRQHSTGLHGAFTALVTPFDTQGAIDEPGLRRLIDFQVDQGIDGVVPCGTTGESPTLTWEEHDRVVEVVVDAVRKRAGVIAGTGSNNTAEAIRATGHAAKLGVDAVLMVDCYYNGPSSLELRHEYYERVLNEVADVPIIPYVIPGRSGCSLAKEDLAMLCARYPQRVIGVKEATGDFERMRQTRALVGASCAILSGDDPLTVEMMLDPDIASEGTISVISNLAPAAVAAATRCARARDAREAQALDAKLAPLAALVGFEATSRRELPDGRTFDVVDRFRNPAPIKTMMAGLGMCAYQPRPPLGRMTHAAVARCREALNTVHQKSPEVLAPIESAFDINVRDRLADDAVWTALGR